MKILLIILIIAVAVLVMRYRRQIFKWTWGKKTLRSLAYKIATDDGAVVTADISVASGCAVIPEPDCRAYTIDPPNQYLDEHNQWCQVAGERSAFPKASRVKRVKTANDNPNAERDLINGIYDENLLLTLQRQFLKANSSNTVDKVLWIVAIPCAAFVIIYGINHMHPTAAHTTLQIMYAILGGV